LSSEKGHISVVVFLINQISGFHEGNKCESYLHWAAENGLLRVVECLVIHGADINAKTDYIEFLYLLFLLFIMRLQVVIIMLLNI